MKHFILILIGYNLIYFAAHMPSVFSLETLGIFVGSILLVLSGMLKVGE